MRQTPFGVWNHSDGEARGYAYLAAMRQTPFGVWNQFLYRAPYFAVVPLQ